MPLFISKLSGVIRRVLPLAWPYRRRGWISDRTLDNDGEFQDVFVQQKLIDR
jgi:hypothetical protein